MTIQQFSIYLDKLDQTASRNEMTEILSDLFTQAHPDEIDIICYLSLGRLTPKFRRIEFQMSSKSMAKVIARAYDVEEEKVTELFKEMGDLGSVAAQIANSKDPESIGANAQSVSDIYQQLLAIAQEEGSGSVERKIQGFSKLLQTLDPLSAKFITRIPIGALRLGFSDMTIIDALSWMEAGDKSLRKEIEHAFNISADIGRIAKAFKAQGLEGITHLTITPGIPIRPQQAERLGTAEEMIAKIGSAAVEWKLDGFRAQVHISNDQGDHRTTEQRKQLQLGEITNSQDVQIFSRSLDNTTAMFPEIVEAFEKLPLASAIFDGEAIGYDPKTGKHKPFQETISRKRKYGISEAQQSIPLRYYAFDLLALDGKSYLTKPFHERRARLEILFQKLRKHIDPQSLALADQWVTDDPEVLDAQFDVSVTKGYEGIMVKKNDAIYQAGARNYNWVKFKHHGEGKLSDTLDCVVMGYYAGKGKRSGFGIGAFLVGVRKSDKLRMTNDEYVTVAKIGTGLSDEQWKDIKVKSDALRVTDKPDEYSAPKDLEPDVWVKPGIVVEIAADEITKSPMHTAGLALRFPRLVRFRDDKSVADSTTKEEVVHMFSLQ